MARIDHSKKATNYRRRRVIVDDGSSRAAANLTFDGLQQRDQPWLVIRDGPVNTNTCAIGNQEWNCGRRKARIVRGHGTLNHISLGTVRTQSLQERGQDRCKLLPVERLTLPDRQHLPSETLQRRFSFPIALHIATKLFLPLLLTRLRRCRPLASRMTVPETTVDEDNLPSNRKYQIRMTRKTL